MMRGLGVFPQVLKDSRMREEHNFWKIPEGQTNGDAVSVSKRNEIISSGRGESITGVKYLRFLHRNERVAGFKGIYR